MKFPFLSYTTRHHLKRRFKGADWLFILAFARLVAGVLIVMRLG